MEINYKNLFEQSFKHSNNLLLLLSDSLVILDINPSAETILGWRKHDVCKRFIGDIFKEYATTAFININIAPKKSTRTTVIRRNANVLKIKWNIIPIISVDQHTVVLISGEPSHQAESNEIDNIQLDTVVKYAPGLVYWKDKNSVYQGCNEEFARLAGLKCSEQVKGKTDFDLIWKEGAAHYIAGDQKVLETGKPNLNIEEVVATANNSKITVISNKVPLLNSKGHVIGIMGITTDITHQKEIEHNLKTSKEAAEAANQAKITFIANMSHDIRTPLTGVIGLSEMLENTLQNPEQKAEAHMLHDSGEELLSLLNAILDDVQAGNVSEKDLREEKFDLRRCIQDLVKLELPTTKIKGLGLDFSIDANVPRYIISDRTKIHRILLNLLGNAIKFTESGHITIEVKAIDKSESEARLQFAITDTGIGIPKNLQDKVFDRFFRVTPSYKGLYAGHGLGLHIAQSYVNLLGGHIALTSEENVGATFHFELWCKISHDEDINDDTAPSLFVPNTVAAKNDPLTLAHSSNIANILPVTSNGPHLLLVEDNQMALKVLESMVLKTGCRFKSAMNGEDAFELAKSNQFDLIITDIGLPGISGNQLAFQIRQCKKNINNKTPIIGLTGHAKEATQADCLESGMNDIFTKPINIEIIQSIINQHVLMVNIKEKHALSASSEGLGLGLPSTEKELFELDRFPIFDIQRALDTIPDSALLVELLNEFISDEGQKDIFQMQEAYIKNDWARIDSIAHKVKGGAIYLGICRLQFACQYLERYYKSGHRAKLKKLYQQLLLVNQETLKMVSDWLNKLTRDAK